jgi:hypothetical protein
VALAGEHKRPGTYDDVFRTTRHDPRIFPPSATKRQNLESASASGWSAGATFLGLYGSRIRTYSLPSSGRPGRAVVRRSKLRTRSLAGLACHTIRTRQPPFGNRDPDPNLSRGRFVRVASPTNQAPRTTRRAPDRSGSDIGGLDRPAARTERHRRASGHCQRCRLNLSADPLDSQFERVAQYVQGLLDKRLRIGIQCAVGSMNDPLRTGEDNDCDTVVHTTGGSAAGDPEQLG